MIRITTGTKVQHNFSREIGYVLEIRRDKQKYNYKVEWQAVLSGKLDLKIDWYKREVLEVV